MKYSIIIPVYNVERYIRACMESVVYQTFQDYEVVVVDDGTPDRSMDIVREYIYTGKIKMVHQANGGIAKARFSGIDAASGDYLLFVDSDDFVSTHLLECVERYIGDADILEYGSVSFWDGNENAVTDRGIQGTLVCNYDRDEFRHQIVTSDIVQGKRSCLMWNKVYRRQLVQAYVIDKTTYSPLEDFMFNCQYYCGVDKYRRITNPLYFYRDRPGSITKRIDPNILEILNNASKVQSVALAQMSMLNATTQSDISSWYLQYMMNALEIGFFSNIFSKQTIKDILVSDSVSLRCQMVRDTANDTFLYQLVRCRNMHMIVFLLKGKCLFRAVYSKLRQVRVLRGMKKALLNSIIEKGMKR